MPNPPWCILPTCLGWPSCAQGNCCGLCRVKRILAARVDRRLNRAHPQPSLQTATPFQGVVLRPIDAVKDKALCCALGRSPCPRQGAAQQRRAAIRYCNNLWYQAY